MPIEFKSVADSAFIFKTTLIGDNNINMDIYNYTTPVVKNTLLLIKNITILPIMMKKIFIL